MWFFQRAGASETDFHWNKASAKTMAKKPQAFADFPSLSPVF
jgi:hypothetical protein